MNRDQALEELKLRLFDKDILLRSIFVEAIMEELAGYFNADIHLWGLAGLLHDIDYEKTLEHPELHGIKGADILENMDIDEAIIYSVRAHNDLNNIPRKRKMDKALYLADFVSDEILVRWKAEKESLKRVTALDIKSSLENRGLGSKEFEELDLSTEDFIDLSLAAIRSSAKVDL
ncbi:MAG: putative domain HDIG-containing protein [Eubacterium sp.]|jgi:putative nucleotidyltransferase with HDIG domain|nr:putative domain HDIG-containing protein [Eubacterium sp.]